MSEPSVKTWQPPVLNGPGDTPPIDFRIQDREAPRNASPTEAAALPSKWATPARDAIAPGDSLEQIAERQPSLVARLIQDILDAARTHAEIATDSLERAAIVVMHLGPLLAGRVFQHCDDDDLRSISAHILNMKSVSATRREEVLEEARERLVGGNIGSRGGGDFVHGFLYSARGNRRFALLAEIKGTTGEAFRRMNEIDHEQLISRFQKEHPQTLALILSQIDSLKAAAILDGLPEKVQKEVISRLATFGRVSPEVMQRLEENLSDEIDALTSDSTSAGGPRVLAHILNRTGRSTEKACLETLDDLDVDLAERVRLQMFTFDDIANLADDDLKVVLSEIDPDDLAVALRGAEDRITRRFLDHLQENRRETYESAAAALGKVRMNDVENVQIKIVHIVRDLEVNGKVTVVRGEGEQLL